MWFFFHFRRSKIIERKLIWEGEWAFLDTVIVWENSPSSGSVLRRQLINLQSPLTPNLQSVRPLEVIPWNIVVTTLRRERRRSCRVPGKKASATSSEPLNYSATLIFSSFASTRRSSKTKFCSDPSSLNLLDLRSQILASHNNNCSDTHLQSHINAELGLTSRSEKVRNDELY